MPKKLIALAAGVAALALPIAIATPATAATLPVGDSLYGISCEASPEPDAADLFSVDADTANLTLIGNTGVADDCAGPAAYDPTTGKSYYLSLEEGALGLIDVTTGATTTTPITGDSTDAPDGFAIGLDGRAWITWDENLYSLDLETGVTTLAVAGLTENCLYSFAVDPTDGNFYAIECSTGEVFRVSVSDGVLTPIGSVTLIDNTSSMQIDTSGRWWVQVDEGVSTECECSLWSTPRPAGPTEMEYEGDFAVSGSETVHTVRSLLLTYPAPAAEPQLAATGVDATPALTVGVVLAALGALVVLGARRRRSA